ncbi:hypothetical protein HAX54_009455, partial [Datura stramonium]|nr:hypothetical protein [Datura stramonium]
MASLVKQHQTLDRPQYRSSVERMTRCFCSWNPTFDKWSKTSPEPTRGFNSPL